MEPQNRIVISRLAMVGSAVLPTLLAIVGLLAVALLSGRHHATSWPCCGPGSVGSLWWRMSPGTPSYGHLRQTLGMDKTLVISAETGHPFSNGAESPDHQPGLRDFNEFICSPGQSRARPGQSLMPPGNGPTSANGTK